MTDPLQPPSMLPFLSTTNVRPPFSGSLFFGAQLFTILGLATRPFPFSRAIFVPPLFAVYLYLLTTTTGERTLDYILGCHCTVQIFLASDYLLITDSLADLERVEAKSPAATYSFWRRVRWAAELLPNVRGIGWNFQVKNVPPLPTEGRLRFLEKRLVRSVMTYLIWDALQVYQRLRPAFDPASGVSLADEPFVRRLVDITLWWYYSYLCLVWQHGVLSILAVGTGLSSPADWPDLVGGWSEAYTVRRFWGRTWHQNSRRYLTTHANALRRYLKISPGTFASRQFFLYTCFILSGIHHTGGDFMVNGRLGTSLSFFLMQALIITLEDTAIILGKRWFALEESRRWNLLGYIWVALWASVSSVGWIDGLVRNGVIAQAGQSSVVWKLWSGEWGLP